MAYTSTRMPARRAALGLSPTARMRKPTVVRHSSAQTRKATTTASSTPRCSRVGARRGKSAANENLAVWGMKEPFWICTGSISGPLSR